MERIAHYIEALYAEKKGLNKKEYIDQTALKAFIPVVDDDVARILQLLITLKRPARILEIGTSIGYSTSSMAKAIQTWDGRITSIEYDERVAAQAQENFRREGVDDVIELVIDDARKALPRLEPQYDLIFQDADKHLYPDLFEECVRLLKPGALFLAEDTLFPVIDLDPKWHGLIAPIERFNKLIAGDERIVSTILPVGDGLTIAIKKAP